MPPTPSDLPPDAPSDKATPLNPETAPIVLRLDHAISAFRAGEATGIHALDLFDRLPGHQADNGVMHDTLSRSERRRMPRRADSVELAILTALADTYGSEMLTNASLGYALRLVARHGGVALIQRILWGESASDVQLAVMLGATRAAFKQIAFAFSDDLLAEANDVLAGFRSRPPRDGKSTKPGRG